MTIIIDDDDDDKAIFQHSIREHLKCVFLDEKMWLTQGEP